MFITGSSPRLQRPIPRSASGARPKSLTKESDDSGLVVVHHLERFLKRARRSSRIWNEILDVWESQKT